VEEPVSVGPVGDAVSAIERELGRIWSAPPEDAGETPKVRASTMNLVVAMSAHELEHERDAKVELSRTHAGRTFLLWVDPRLAPWDLTSDVQAMCQKQGSAEVCSDRIELGFGVSAAQRAASVIAALALGEVPTILEVARGAHDALVDELAPRADRVVVDTAVQPVARVAHIARATQAAIADRNFVRGFTFRDLVARFFDAEPSEARTIRRVEIARTPGFRIEPAALLVGWLASRLGWKLEAKDRAVDAAGRPVAIALTAEAREGLGAGEIVAVRLALEAGETRSIERQRDNPRVICWTRDGEKHDHPLGFRDETWVMTKALDDARIDRVYREAVLAAAAWEAL
jgi:hypothetical protein